MAKKKAAKPSTPATNPFAGKTVAFVGDLGYYKMAGWCETWLAERNGTVVKPTAKMAVLVYGQGRGGKTPGDVAKIQKRVPDVEVMSLAEFATALLPDSVTFAEQLRTGAERDYEFWDAFSFFSRLAKDAGTRLDLSGADLRGAKLSGAKLGEVIVSGADFRDADVRYANLSHRLPGIDGAKFDGAQLYAATIRHATKCSFRKANLDQMWGDGGGTFNGCDFRDAVLTRFRGFLTTFAECDFRAANVADANFEISSFTGCDLGGATLTHLHANGAKFTDCKFGKANLQRAYLAGASLTNADLRGADLRYAVLAGADLTGADVTGVDLDGAILVGAKVGGVDFSRAKNYTPPGSLVVGPKVTELATALAALDRFETTVQLETDTDWHVGATVRFPGSSGKSVVCSYGQFRGDESHGARFESSVEQGFGELAMLWPAATPRLDTVTVKGVRGAKWQSLVAAVWAEAFGTPVDTGEALDARKAAQATEATRKRDELMATIRIGGLAVWYALDYRKRERLDLRGADFSGADLSSLEFREFNTGYKQDCRGAKFVGAKLVGARLYSGNFTGAAFTDADLTLANLGMCEKAVFVRANLTNADCTQAKLQGADFTDATLTGVKFEKAQFDEHTKFPKGFRIPAEMVWKGTGPRPGVTVAKTSAAGSIDFDAFFKGLPRKVDSGRIANATAMLKAERFQLYADVTDAHLVGIVKSQSSSERVYSCRLGADGSFCCGTQNLRPCGGLRGALCKHLMVLVIGLAKAGKLDPAVADNWVNASKGHQPAWDDATKDAMSETFLKFKGVEAGEIDWRPTETIPEDYYAM